MLLPILVSYSAILRAIEYQNDHIDIKSSDHRVASEWMVFSKTVRLIIPQDCEVRHEI